MSDADNISIDSGEPTEIFKRFSLKRINSKEIDQLIHKNSLDGNGFFNSCLDSTKDPKSLLADAGETGVVGTMITHAGTGAPSYTDDGVNDEIIYNLDLNKDLCRKVSRLPDPVSAEYGSSYVSDSYSSCSSAENFYKSRSFRRKRSVSENRKFDWHLAFFKSRDYLNTMIRRYVKQQQPSSTKSDVHSDSKLKSFYTQFLSLRESNNKLNHFLSKAYTLKKDIRKAASFRMVSKRMGPQNEYWSNSGQSLPEPSKLYAQRNFMSNADDLIGIDCVNAFFVQSQTGDSLLQSAANDKTVRTGHQNEVDSYDSFINFQTGDSECEPLTKLSLQYVPTPVISKSKRSTNFMPFSGKSKLKKPQMARKSSGNRKVSHQHEDEVHGERPARSKKNKKTTTRKSRSVKFEFIEQEKNPTEIEDSINDVLDLIKLPPPTAKQTKRIRKMKQEKRAKKSLD